MLVIQQDCFEVDIWFWDFSCICLFSNILKLDLNLWLKYSEMKVSGCCKLFQFPFHSGKTHVFLTHVFKIQSFKDHLIDSFFLTNSSFCFCCFSAYEWSFFSIYNIWKAKQHNLITSGMSFPHILSLCKYAFFSTLCLFYSREYVSSTVTTKPDWYVTVLVIKMYELRILLYSTAFAFIADSTWFFITLMLLYSVFQQISINI